jgi:hypothetical protein
MAVVKTKARSKAKAAPQEPIVPQEIDGEAARGEEMIPFNNVKIFSVTTSLARSMLGDTVTAWLVTQRSLIEIADIKLVQSSDSEYHCISIVVFYNLQTPA